MQDDTLIDELLARGRIKRCPNPECGILIEKDGGCEYIQCYICKIEFCWLCIASSILRMDVMINHITLIRKIKSEIYMDLM